MRRTAVRRTAALLTAAVAVTTLAACTGSGEFGGCAPDFASGAASELVADSTDFGATPDVDLTPTPLISEGSQRSTLIAGDGALVEHGDQVDFAYAVYTGSDGTLLGAFGFDGDGQVARGQAGLDDNTIAQALACTEVGGRYALTTSITDGFGESAASSLGMDPDDTIIVILDVIDAFPGKSEGLNQLPQDGMPTVVTDVDGTPGVQLPDAEVPTELRVATIKAGSGAVVAEGDTVSVQYSLFTWPSAGGDPVPVQSTWDSHRAVDFTVSTDGLIEGFVTALVGARVGDQILAVIPPDLGYGADGSSDGTIPADATLIYVIDVLALQDSGN